MGGVKTEECTRGGRCDCRRIRKCKSKKRSCKRPRTCFDPEGKKRCFAVEACNGYDEFEGNANYTGFAACNGERLIRLRGKELNKFGKKYKKMLSETCDLDRVCTYIADRRRDFELGAGFTYTIKVKN